MKLIGIYSRNRYEWFVTDWACVLFGMTTVPLYDTLGVENLTYCLEQTEMTTLFISSESLPTFLELKNIGRVKCVIGYDPVDEQTIHKLRARGVQYLDYFQLIK